MLLFYMSNAELQKEINNDVQYLKDFIVSEFISGKLGRNKRKKFKQLSPRSRKNYYWTKTLNIKTLNKNLWKCQLRIFHKVFTYNLIVKVNEKSRYKVITTNQQTVFVYSNHFFSRYYERCFKKKYSHHVSSIADDFFIHNPFWIELPSYFGNIETSSREILFAEGLGLGKYDKENDVVDVKTFISFNELKKTQLDKVYQSVLCLWEQTKANQNDISNTNKRQNNDCEAFISKILQRLTPRLNEYYK